MSLEELLDVKGSVAHQVVRYFVNQLVDLLSEVFHIDVHSEVSSLATLASC